MSRRRITSDEERELFETELAEAAPLGKAVRRPRKKSTGAALVSPGSSAKPVPSKRSVQHHDTGLDGNTEDRLRRGLLLPQAKLDLHGLTQRDAHDALVTFLRAAALRRLRLVLIVTGKGGETGTVRDHSLHTGLEISQRGVLRTLTPRWLKEPGPARLIARVREAHRRHGGAGALYVYLRKQT